MSKSLFIFHFRPIEHYPPIQNFISSFASTNINFKRFCFTTNGQMNPISYYKKEITLFRFGRQSTNKIVLWWAYLWYNFGSILYLFFKRPTHILYYETLSSFPAYLYKRFGNSKVNIYIHYHEYTSPSEYKTTSPVERWFHKLEKKLYNKAIWISHTNKQRLDLFLKDEKLIKNPEIHRSLPNWPLKKWAKQNRNREKGDSLKIIYVGYALDEKSTYIREFVEWLQFLRQEIELSIYCLKMDSFPDDLIENAGNLRVTLKSAIPYSELPTILSQCHVGVVLYKGLVDNYVYNAPNKLFEYLSCGLDVWYPTEMQGVYEYDSTLSPKVIRLDFAKLSELNFEKMIKSEVKSKSTIYSAEEVYASLLNHMNQ